MLGYPRAQYLNLCFFSFTLMILLIIFLAMLNCLQMTLNYVPQTKFGRHIVFAPFLIIILIIKSPNEVWRLVVFAPFLIIIFFFSSWTCPTKFSETDDPIFTKIHRKVDPYLKRCHQVLVFSKWPPLPWKSWTYVKIAYIRNCQRDFHKAWHIY